MTTCIFLKSIQGTGKSIITEFLMNKVLGTDSCWLTQDASLFTGRFSGCLSGRLLLILEELPSQNSGDWRSLGNSLKQWITGQNLKLESKGKDAIQVKNIASLILLSNNNAVPISPDDRRMFMPDISIDYKGNYDYFDNLLKYTKDSKVGEAFYWYCKEFSEKDVSFDEQRDLPKTEAKNDIIMENLHTVYAFIKVRYLLKGKGIERISLSEFRKKYIMDLHLDSEKNKRGIAPLYRNHNTDVRPQDISKKLKEAGIGTKVSTGNRLYISEIKFDALHEIFKKNKWLDEHDVIDPEGWGSDEEQDDGLEPKTNTPQKESNAPKPEILEKINSINVVEELQKRLQPLKKIDREEIVKKMIKKEIQKFLLEYKCEQCIIDFMNSDRVFKFNKYEFINYLNSNNKKTKSETNNAKRIDVDKCCDDVIRLFKNDDPKGGFLIPGTKDFN